MIYQTYVMLIGDMLFSKWVEVVAVSFEAASQDIAQAYELPIIQWRVK